MYKERRFVVTTPAVIDKAKRRFAIVKGILGLILGFMCAYGAAAGYIFVHAMITTPMDGTVTLGDVYDAALERSPHLGIATASAVLLTIVFGVIQAYINPFVPVSRPPRKYIKRMFIAEVLAAVVPTLGYCALGWLGFAIGCVAPVLMFPWDVRNFSA